MIHISMCRAMGNYLDEDGALTRCRPYVQEFDLRDFENCMPLEYYTFWEWFDRTHFPVALTAVRHCALATDGDDSGVGEGG